MDGWIGGWVDGKRKTRYRCSNSRDWNSGSSAIEEIGPFYHSVGAETTTDIYPQRRSSMRIVGVLTMVTLLGGSIGLARAQMVPKKAGPHDSAYAAMQQRGKAAMGVDQYTSTHHFDELADGGIIRLVRDVDDTEGVEQIRAHLRAEARAFRAGDFSMPEFVHMQMVPGSEVMAAKRGAITYTTRDVPRGAEFRITTRDAEALAAIHQFL